MKTNIEAAIILPH